MKIFKRKFICFFILACSVKYGSAQVILDTIYVNEKLSISVRFPNIPSHWYWNPEQPPYDIESIPNSGFTVGSRTKFTPAAHLYVTVVKRSLHFLVMYKKNIDYEDYTQTDYDFTSLKKIDDRIKQREEEARNPVSRSESKTENKSENKSVSKKSGADNDDSYAYYTLLGSGDKKFKLQQYAEAKADYDKALKMRPDDQIAVQRISEVKTKLEEKDKKQKKQQDAYKNYMAAGEKSLKLNKLEEAKNSFVQALVIVEADKAATSRIAQIEEKEKLAKQNEELETNYSNTLADADKAFQKEDYEKAKALYNKALGYIKRPGPTEQIALIDKIAKEKADKEAEGKISKLKQKENEQKDKEEAAKKKKYYAALKDADGLFKDGDLAKAKLAYNKAQEIDSNDPWPRDQVNRINKLLSDQDLKEKTAKQKEAIRLEKEKKEKEVKELENRYNIALEKADKFFKDENYAEAKPAYIAAMAIIKKPWPQDQVKKIDAILAEQAATAKAEKLRLEKEKIITAKYNEVIHSADAELSKNNYAKSKKLYANALGIKPL